MQGVLAAAYHGHIFAAIEKGIAGGAIADAVALEARQPRMRGVAREAPVARITASAG